MSIKRVGENFISIIPFSHDKKNIMKKRLKKLKRNPKLFFRDSFDKRKVQIRRSLPIKYKANNDFTIVSAVYNVDKYLDDYFISLVNQTLNFKDYIKIVIIDDGSTDNSAILVKKWQDKYPNNIKYIYKQNGGQSTARNLGLEYVTTKWVTFIDPDDFVDLSYFREIDIAISNNKDVSMIVTNLNFFMEETSTVKKTHPLRYRFNENINKVKNSNLNNYINLSSSATIFDNDLIVNSGLQFDPKVKPNFEDGRFIAEYLLLSNNSFSVFLNKATYFYRKREDGSSTLDLAWKRKEKYKDVLIYGFLETLDSYYKEFGFVPKNIQNTVLYDLVWYIQYLLNKPEKLDFLSEIEKKDFYELYKEVFSYIDEDTILDFKLAGTWFFHKIGMLGCFKKKEPNFQIFYIENVDKNKKQILISMFSYFKLPFSFELNGKDIIPSYSKVISHDFNGETFVYEFRYWISYCNENDLLHIKIGDSKASKISIHGNHYNETIKIRDILKNFIQETDYISNGSWLLMDRETNADDNAEHLYRYLMNYQPQIKCVFALDKNSQDWNRLQQEGFNLVEFGSIEFENVLRQCSKIVSSHLETHINNYFGDNYGFSKKFIFLQHGVIKDDLSAWINTKKLLNCFITSTQPEYESLLSSDNKYRLTEKEVVLTGLPRHDSLLEKVEFTKNTILVMPTWRHYIVGEIIGKGANERTINKNFMSTAYAKHWSSFLNSNKLAELVKNYDYNIIFAPHSNISPYINQFSLPSYIELWDPNNSLDSMQEIFKNSKLLVTDYSSVTFEMGLLHKLSIYYQFDRNEFFSGIHTYQQGYFSYENNGFGPLAFTQEDLLRNLEMVLEKNCKLTEPYKTRITETFPFTDGKNSERVYNAIVALDQPDEQKINVDILYDMTLMAYESEAWELVESRSSLLMKYGNISQISWAKSIFNEALFYQNKFVELFVSLETNEFLKESYYWKARVAFATTNWNNTIYLLKNETALDNELKLILLHSYAKAGWTVEFEELKKKLQSNDSDINPVALIMIEAWSLLICEEWEKIIQLMEIELPDFRISELRTYLPQLLVAEAYRHLSKFSEAHEQLVNFENHTANHINCYIEIAKLAFARDNYEKCIVQYKKAVNGVISILPEEAILEYMLSQWNMNDIDSLLKSAPECIALYPNNTKLKEIYFRGLARQEKWVYILEEASALFLEDQKNIVYSVTLARYRLGLIDEAYQNCIKPNNDHFYEYWSLIGEIALLVEDFELAKYCYKGMIAIYPNYDSSKNWIRLNSIKK